MAHGSWLMAHLPVDVWENALLLCWRPWGPGGQS